MVNDDFDDDRGPSTKTPGFETGEDSGGNGGEPLGGDIGLTIFGTFGMSDIWTSSIIEKVNFNEFKRINVDNLGIVSANQVLITDTSHDISGLRNLTFNSTNTASNF